MGVYLASEVIKMRYNVFIASRSSRKSDNNKITFPVQEFMNIYNIKMIY